MGGGAPLTQPLTERQEGKRKGREGGQRERERERESKKKHQNAHFTPLVVVAAVLNDVSKAVERSVFYELRAGRIRTD